MGDDHQPRTLAVPDYCVVGGMLGCSIAIGLFQAYRAKKNNHGTEGYLLGNRSMSFLPVAISLAVNFKSAVTILGIPADVYQFGIVLSWLILSLPLSALTVCCFIIPVLYNLKISSTYEYLEKRYGRPIRMIATSAFLIQTLLYLGVNIYAPALALSRVTGFSQVPAMLTTALVCVTYTTLGGIRGVVWSDVFQAAIMAIAMIAFLIRGTMVAGGIDVVWNQMLEGGRQNLDRFDLDPRIRYTFWSVVFGGTVLWTANLGTNQTNIQRFLSVKSVAKARWAAIIGSLGICVMTALATGCGVVLYSLFHTCDPIKSGCIRIRDELMPYAAMDIFRSFPGMRGLFLAGVFSASLSTVSSGLNAMVSVIVADFLKPFTTWTDARYAYASRILTVCAGILIIGTGFLISNLGDIVPVAVSVVGAFGGAFLGMFLIGIWMPFVNSWGAGVGFSSGVSASFITFLGSKGFKKPQYLARKLPISTLVCPAQCGYLDSMNVTAIADYNTTTAITDHIAFNLTTATSGGYTLSSIDDHELSLLQNYFSISYFYVSVLGLLYTMFIGIGISLITGGWKKRHAVDKRTVDPISLSRISKCLPTRMRDCVGYTGHDGLQKGDRSDDDKENDEKIPLSRVFDG